MPDNILAGEINKNKNVGTSWEILACSRLFILIYEQCSATYAVSHHIRPEILCFVLLSILALNCSESDPLYTGMTSGTNGNNFVGGATSAQALFLTALTLKGYTSRYPDNCISRLITFTAF